MSKRFISILLALILSASALASCSNQTAADTSDSAAAETSDAGEAAEAATEDAAAAEETEELTDGLPDTDFDGYTFRVLTCDHHQDTYSFIAADELTGVPLNDALYNSTVYIEERFNVDVTSVDSGSTDENAAFVKNAVNGGDNSFDITIGHDQKTLSLGTNGYLRNVYDFEQFDMSKPWWPDNAVESWTVNGKMFAVSNYLSYCGIHWTRIIVVNKDVADDLGIEVPYDMVREGTWTMDAMQSLAVQASADLDGDGKMTNSDRFGYAMFRTGWYTLQEALDLPIYRRDETGTLYVDMDVERADEIGQKLAALITPEIYHEDTSTFDTSMFEGGNFLFAYMQLKDIYNSINDLDARAGYLSTPKLDENQENYINCCTDAPWGIPSFVQGDQQNIVGTIVEAMSCKNYKDVIPAYFEVALKARLSDSPDDAEMLQLIADTRTIGFAYGYDLPLNDMVEQLSKNPTNAASIMERNTKMANKSLAKIIDKIDAIGTEETAE